MDKILVVEDELLVALVYEKFLVKHGFNIVGPFTTGYEAIESIDSTEDMDYIAVLLDVQLDDEISGLEVAELIRVRSDVPIIFTTGNDVLKTQKETEHLPNVYILPKPVNTEKLLEILKTV